MFRLSEYTRRIEELKVQTQEALERASIPFYIDESQSAKLKIVFAGQYSAGKSSILKMLTGREDIEIGVGITTQKANTYEWNGMEVIDTPGIHTQLRPDHDEISYAAIGAADMLVYVVTNELFDDHLAAHFRKLAIDRDKAGEMILVINKMERASEGNSLAQQSIIREDIKKVIEPYTPEELGLCFIDAESYLDSIEERSEDPELADELLARSGYQDFIETLNHFVETKSLTSRATTTLYQIQDLLQNASQQLQPSSADDDISALEENYMQQRHVLSDARIRLQQDIQDIFTSAAAEVRNIGLEVADYLVEGCKKDDIEEELAGAVRKADKLIESCQEDAVHTLEDRLVEMGQAIDAIENSEFSQNLKTRLTGKFASLPDNIKKVLGGTMGNAQKAGNIVMKNAYNASAEGGLKLASFSGSKIHGIVLDAGHAIGYKFKPWQAIKITKGIAIGGQILSAFGVGLSVFMQIKSDQDEEQMRSDLKSNRQAVRSQFNSAANGLEDYGRTFIKNNIAHSLDASIDGLDENISEIRATRTNKNAICKEMEALHHDCQVMIREIHSI